MSLYVGVCFNTLKHSHFFCKNVWRESIIFNMKWSVPNPHCYIAGILQKLCKTNLPSAVMSSSSGSRGGTFAVITQLAYSQSAIYRDSHFTSDLSKEEGHSLGPEPSYTNTNILTYDKSNFRDG